MRNYYNNDFFNRTNKIKQGQKIAQLIVSNIMYPEIKLVKFLKSTERNDKDLVKWILIINKIYFL